MIIMYGKECGRNSEERILEKRLNESWKLDSHDKELIRKLESRDVLNVETNSPFNSFIGLVVAKMYYNEGIDVYHVYYEDGNRNILDHKLVELEMCAKYKTAEYYKAVELHNSVHYKEPVNIYAEVGEEFDIVTSALLYKPYVETNPIDINGLVDRFKRTALLARYKNYSVSIPYKLGHNLSDRDWHIVQKLIRKTFGGVKVKCVR